MPSAVPATPPTVALRWLLVLGAVVAIGPLSIDMYLPALPELQRALGTDPAAVQWTLAAFFAGLAGGQLVYGPLSDRWGRRTPLLVGLAVFVLASLLCSQAPSIHSLIALRLLQALGSCAGMVITRAMVRDRFAPQDMARILSMLVLVMGVAPMLAPLAGSAVLRYAGWQAIFLVLAGFGSLCFAAVALSLAESHPPERRLASLSILSALRGFAHLMTHRKFLGYALAGAAAQGGMFAYITVSSFVFIQAFGLSPIAYSWLFGVNAAGLIAASQVNSVLLRRMPAQVVLRHALNTYLGAGVLMTLSAVTGIGGLAGIVVTLWVCMASLGFTFPNSTAAAMAPFGDRAGSASALLGTLQFATAGAMSYLVGHLYDGTAVPMAGVIAGCGAVSVLLLRWAGRA
ncbi:MAG TPA: multidrug effflux MFS transporter [Candidatus Binatia bacterium]|nr:multidrug effflux MFS transporter [Candidatus Binatia bacterium]